MSGPIDDTREALEILSEYQCTLLERMAREIVEHREDFENPFVGSAEVLIDKYYHLLQCLCPITSGLRVALVAMGAEPPTARKPPPPKPERVPWPEREPHKPLEKDEFRCFRCHGIIQTDAESCPACGWTWG